LVEIGSVVSEEKICQKFHPHFFLFLAWWPSWLEVRITGHNFGRGPSKDNSTKVWLQLAQWFLRRRLKCEMLMDGRRTKSDGNSSHGLKARGVKKECKATCTTDLSDLMMLDGRFEHDHSEPDERSIQRHKNPTSTSPW
jgi:hypothetical protein